LVIHSLIYIFSVTVDVYFGRISFLFISFTCSGFFEEKKTLTKSYHLQVFVVGNENFALKLKVKRTGVYNESILFSVKYFIYSNQRHR